MMSFQALGALRFSGLHAVRYHLGDSLSSSYQQEIKALSDYEMTYFSPVYLQAGDVVTLYGTSHPENDAKIRQVIEAHQAQRLQIDYLGTRAIDIAPEALKILIDAATSNHIADMLPARDDASERTVSDVFLFLKHLDAIAFE